MPDALDQLHLSAARQVAAADVGVVAAQGQRDVVERQIVFGQQRGVEQHVILFFVTSPTVHFGHAGDRSQMGPHQPMLDRAQLGQIVTVALEQVVVDFAHAAGDRSQLGLVHAGLVGQFGDGQPLADQLAGAENVEAVLEDRVDLRQAKLGNRADLGQAGQSADHLLDRIGDLDLDLFGAQGRHHRVDLHHHGTGVGKGIDRQTGQREKSRNHQRSGEQQHDGAMFEAETDDAIEHGSWAGCRWNGADAEGGSLGRAEFVFFQIAAEEKAAGGDDHFADDSLPTSLPKCRRA